MKNKGLHQYRFKDNPLEKRFSKVWEEYNTNRLTGQLDGKCVLDYLLAKDCNNPKEEATERDRTVAATVIQWLGSPVGSHFIREALG